MKPETKLTGPQRAELMRAAHHLQPVAVIGRAGLTDAVRSHVDRELLHHELIKVRFVDHKELTRELTEEIAGDLGAIVVATIGHTAILYRPESEGAEE